MNEKNYSKSFLVDQRPEEVYQAINHVRGWWSEEIEGTTDEEGKEWFYHYQDIHLCKVKVEELIYARKVVWRVVENSFNFIDDQSEWVDNLIIFDITMAGDQTKLTFTQHGLTPDLACFQVCRDGWDNYIANSLEQLITTGKGSPNPKEGEGFNKELADKWSLHS